MLYCTLDSGICQPDRGADCLMMMCRMSTTSMTATTKTSTSTSAAASTASSRVILAIFLGQLSLNLSLVGCSIDSTNCSSRVPDSAEPRGVHAACTDAGAVQLSVAAYSFKSDAVV